VQNEATPAMTEWKMQFKTKKEGSGLFHLPQWCRRLVIVIILRVAPKNKEFNEEKKHMIDENEKS
jgi:hypothetical protein